MRVEITDKLISVVDSSVIGFLVSAGGAYKVAVSKSYGEKHNVEDISFAEYLDVNEIKVVPIGRESYAVCDRSLGYIEKFADTPMELLGDSIAYYGYVFKSQHIVPLDSDMAYERMLDEVDGRRFE